MFCISSEAFSSTLGSISSLIPVHSTRFKNRLTVQSFTHLFSYHILNSIKHKQRHKESVVKVLKYRKPKKICIYIFYFRLVNKKNPIKNAYFNFVVVYILVTL